MKKQNETDTFFPKIIKKKIIKKENLNLENRPLLLQPHKEESAVRISLKKEKNIVRVIEIICSCGNRIDIACEYQNEKSPHP